MLRIIILYYNIMGPLSYMQSVVDRNVVIRHMTVRLSIQYVITQIIYMLVYLFYLQQECIING